MFGLSFALGLDPVLTQRKTSVGKLNFCEPQRIRKPFGHLWKALNSSSEDYRLEDPIGEDTPADSISGKQGRLDPPPNSTCFGPSPFWLFCPVLHPSSWHHHHHLSGWRTTRQVTPFHLSTLTQLPQPLLQPLLQLLLQLFLLLLLQPLLQLLLQLRDNNQAWRKKKKKKKRGEEKKKKKKKGFWMHRRN
ncbi:hypothetical protein INR49_029982, partial [Caranx melampygus]